MMEEQTAPAQTAIKYLRLSCSARQLFSWLRSFLSLLQSEGLPLPIDLQSNFIHGKQPGAGAALIQQSPHQMDYLPVTDTIDTSRSEI